MENFKIRPTTPKSQKIDRRRRYTVNTIWTCKIAREQTDVEILNALVKHCQICTALTEGKTALGALQCH